MIAFDRRLDRQQLGMMRRRFGRGAQVLGVRAHPGRGEHRLAQVVEDEHRSAAHAPVEHPRAAAAGPSDQLGAAAVRRDERGFGRRQRDVVRAARRSAVEASGPASPTGTRTVPMKFSTLRS